MTSATRQEQGIDDTTTYFNDIGRYPVLDAEQEVELQKAIEAGLYAEELLTTHTPEQLEVLGYTVEELEWLAQDGKEAKERFINSNLRLVVSIARKYGRAALAFPDIIQEGNDGLIRAVEKFDYTKGYKFSTYATWWVRQAITRGIANTSRTVRIPVHANEDINRVLKARSDLDRQLGREAEPSDIAAELEVSEEKVVELLKIGMPPIMLDAPLGYDSGDTYYSVIEDAHVIDVEEEAVEKVSGLWTIAMQYLSPEEQYIFTRMMQDEATLDTLAKELGKTKNAVSQIRQEAFHRLKIVFGIIHHTESIGTVKHRPINLLYLYRDHLSKREIEILELLASGLKIAEVGKKLELHPSVITRRLAEIHARTQNIQFKPLEWV